MKIAGRPFSTAGGLLCTLAVFMWLLKCLQELSQTVRFTMALWTAAMHGRNEGITVSQVETVEPSVSWEQGETNQKNLRIHISVSRAVMATVMVAVPTTVMVEV